MRTLLLLLSLLSSTLLPAQEGSTVSIANGRRAPQPAEASWTVRIGSKTVLRSNAEDPARNVVTVKRSRLREKGDFVLTYMPAAPQPGWERTISVLTGSDQELQVHKGNRMRLSGNAFAKLAKGQTELHIYTIALPTDPAIRARVRVRRVHLATIRFL
ncbi:MAG: hypothetical protein EOO11_21835 [Chitinophagaceae bacterium]|nr:MAG: hypothetical protein EOO11_21835 [Chitinophagaceae bacterium]